MSGLSDTARWRQAVFRASVHAVWCWRDSAGTKEPQGHPYRAGTPSWVDNPLLGYR